MISSGDDLSRGRLLPAGSPRDRSGGNRSSQQARTRRKMDLLAGYGDIGDDNSATNSPKDLKGKTGNLAGARLENEWLSFEKMIAPGGIPGEGNVDKSTYLVDGVVAYPGMSAMRKSSMSDVLPEVQPSESDSDEEDGDVLKNPGKEVDDDDAFFKLRKQVKARDRSSSSDGSSDSSSDSTRSPSHKGKSPSPPHLSPVNSVKSHGSDPPELETSDNKYQKDPKPEETFKRETQVEEETKEKSTEKERKRSHRDRSRSKSRPKKHRSRSRSKDRKRRHSSRDRRRHKEKKSHHKGRERKRSRDRKRSRSKDRNRSKSRERKRSRSKEKHESKSKGRSERRDSSRDRKKDKRSRSRSRSRDRKRSKSKDRKDRRDRSRERKKRHRSRSRHRSKDRKSRSRSRSRERLRSRSPVLGKKLTFKEQMRQNILTASKQLTQEKEPEMPTKKTGEALKPSDLLKGIKISSGEAVTPQQALMQTMAAMHQKAQEITGIEVPKYYNPAAVNPLKYAEQVQKRKLLWSKKGDEKQKEKEEQIETQWKSAFIADDNATTTKFRKLMGMKETEEGGGNAESLDKMSEEQRKKQAELFQRLDQEYQFARMTTHTQRGVGLGFTSTVYDPNHPPNPP